MSLYDKILEEGKKIVLEKGVDAINIRLLAKNCNIAIGSIYNYFSSKTDLILAIVEDIWKDIFSLDKEEVNFDNFIDCITWIFKTIDDSNLKYPNFLFFHNNMFNGAEKQKAYSNMNKFLKLLQKKLFETLENDKNIRKNCFNNVLTKEIFLDYIFSLVILTLQKNGDYKPLLELIKNTIY